MANGILELPGTTINAAQMANDPMAQMLEQEYQAGLLAGRGGGPASQAAINPQIREQGLLSANRVPGTPGAQPFGFSAPGGTDELRQIYGLMAQYADDPTKVGQGFVSAMQQQEQLQRQNQPIEQYLRLYGNVNPYDFETDSLQAFHQNYINTGQLQFDLLERKNELTSAEQGFLHEQITNAQEAEVKLGRMAQLSSQFDEMARRGDFYAGTIAGGISEWVKRATGNEDAASMLRTEYHQLMVSDVVKNLPPGVASDKDVALVLAGWPSGVADPAYIAAFLRGMQKIKAIEHAMATHRADFIGRNRGETGPGGETVLQDWNRIRDWAGEASLRQFGGVWNPGAEVPETEAARMRYQQLYGTGAPPPNAPPPPGATQGQPSGVVDPSPQREGESRAEYLRRKYGVN